jgi:hypothetical protein
LFVEHFKVNLLYQNFVCRRDLLTFIVLLNTNDRETENIQRLKSELVKLNAL